MRVLDLFSGIGGFSLGLERAGMETVAFCEIDEFPRKVLKKHWPHIPIYEDIKQLTRERLEHDGIGTVDLVCGGFPCQPFSQAGKQEGFGDDRDLWPEMFRVIQEVRPRWVIGENVAGFINMGLDRTLSDLEGAGFRTEQVVIPACAVGAPHRRDRIWIVANSERNAKRTAYGSDSGGSERGREKQDFSQWDEVGSDIGNGGEDVADSTEPGFQDGSGVPLGEPGEVQEPERSEWWAVEPDVGRVAHGIPKRVDRLKGLGNAVVPQIPEIIGRGIMEIEAWAQHKAAGQGRRA